MSEFKQHYLVGELLELLGSTSSPEKFVEELHKGTSRSSDPALSNVVTQSCIRQLANNSPNSDLFLMKYEELKSKKVYLLEPFMQLLNLVSADENLKNCLAKNVSHTTAGNTQNFTITREDVPQICKNVIKAAVEGERKLNKHISMSDKRIDPPLVSQNWIIDRPRFSWDFPSDVPITPCQKVVPTASQETILLWDILSCLKGIDGSYIISEPLANPYDLRSFVISQDVGTSFKQLAQQILPLASYYSMTVRFGEGKVLPEDGQVNHALRGGLNCLLKDYLLFIVQLEAEHIRGKLNLQKLWFYIQPTMATMSILAHITSTICKASAKGGKVLSLLYEQMNDVSGEAKSKELCLFLIRAASVPYMQTLEKWVYKGVISDPYQEVKIWTFLVEDNELIQREELPVDYSADYWEKRYAVRHERIPVFLSEHAQTILRTGKYLNVIRQCGKTVQWGRQEPLEYQYRGQKYIAAIDRAYSEAARTLLEVLIHENDLMGRLRSVKNYFLLAQGDFVVQFMNLCEGELVKNMYDIVIHRLASLLELALRMSTADSDPYKDDLKPELLPHDLEFQMFRILSIQTRGEKAFSSQLDTTLTGLEAFVFNYDVKWPVSLIINRNAISCYQMIFRQLFYCKHIERLLCRVWISNKIAKTFTCEAAMAYRQAFSLRQRMLDCIQHLEYYMMVEVIEPNWLTFLNKMSKVSNVDDVLSVHQDLLDNCLKECMLTDPGLLGCITSLCAVCIEFCHFMQNEAESVTEGKEGSFKERIARLDTGFMETLVRLLDRIRDLGREIDNEKLLNVLCRLDFNMFYTETLSRQGTSTRQQDISG
ncbi:gamma-tubulin complex component 2 isoform X3 [Athalia rosae]|uniref:gamma-tubulin complex component 2 isoform X3 n=1 Tax=Athalia rosae TaxID=37344 RepID=UPI000A0EDF1B|nr:gamma-tubulin complex component 2 isoform X3 [Athalia rosae]